MYRVIAVCRPTTVVSRSATTWEMDTFITVVSSTMMNCAEASRPTTPQPAFDAAAGAMSAITPPASIGLDPIGGHEREELSRYRRISLYAEN